MGVGKENFGMQNRCFCDGSCRITKLISIWRKIRLKNMVTIIVEITTGKWDK